jgi:hypothetical protein
VAGFGPGVEEVLDELAGVADDEEEGDAGQEAEEGGRFGWVAAGGVRWVLGAAIRQVGGGGHEGLLGAFWLGWLPYQAMDLSRPKRMRRPRAAARRMAQVSVDRLRELRALGVDMWSLLRNASCTRKNV